MRLTYECWVGQGKLGVAAAALLQMTERGEDVTAYSLRRVLGVSAPTARKRLHQISERGGVAIREERKGNHFRRVYSIVPGRVGEFVWRWQLQRQKFMFGEEDF